MSAVFGCVGESLIFSRLLVSIVGQCMNMKISFQAGNIFLLVYRVYVLLGQTLENVGLVLKTLLL